MKKLCSVLTIVCLAVSFAACSVSEPASDGTNSAAEATAVPEGYYEYEGVSLILPEGYLLDETGNVPHANSPDFPDNPSNVAFSKSHQDSIDNYSEKIYQQHYSANMQGFEEISKYETIEIDGIDTIHMTINVTLNTQPWVLDQYILFLPDKCVAFTFSSTTPEDASLHQASIQTIHVK